MYFVVFILQIKEYRVVPYSWILDVHSHMEKFINNGLNSNRRFYTFWTTEPAAFDCNGMPQLKYRPDFNAGFNLFPTEGWYECKIRKFQCT